MSAPLDRQRIYDAFGLTAEEVELCEAIEAVEAPARELAAAQRAAFVAYLEATAAKVSGELSERLQRVLVARRPCRPCGGHGAVWVNWSSDRPVTCGRCHGTGVEPAAVDEDGAGL